MLIILGTVVIFWVYYFIKEVLETWRLFKYQKNPIKRIWETFVNIDKSGFLLCTIALGLVSCIASVFISLLFATIADSKYIIAESTPIYAIQDEIGESFLQRSNTDYLYITKTDEGLKVNKINVQNCYINFTEDIPKMEKYDGYFKFKPFNWIFLPAYTPKYYFFIPEGSVTNEYNIDLKGG